jgi:hypothetical protein
MYVHRATIIIQIANFAEGRLVQTGAPNEFRTNRDCDALVTNILQTRHRGNSTTSARRAERMQLPDDRLRARAYWRGGSVSYRSKASHCTLGTFASGPIAPQFLRIPRIRGVAVV